MKQRFKVVFAVSVLCLLLLTSLFLMGGAAQNSAQFGRIYIPLLLLNALGLIVLIVLIGTNIRHLIQQLRSGTPGAKLTRRLVKMFIIMAVIPVSIVYAFSLDFLRQGIDSWFDVRIGQALTDSMQLSRDALDLRMRELLRQTTQMAEELDQPEQPISPLNLEQLHAPGSTLVVNTYPAGYNLDTLRSRSGAEELALLSIKGHVIASSSGETNIVPNSPDETILLQLQQGSNYIALDPLGDKRLVVRVVVRIPGQKDASGNIMILQAIYPISGNMNQQAETVQAAFAEYQELAYLREQLKISFTMTLTLVLLSTILAAVWAAFYTARRLTAPILDLAAGTAAVAQGEYETTIQVSSEDDLGFLVNSFNQMTRKIALARDEIRRSRDHLETQRAYLEAVLDRLSSGVLTLDREHHIRTANPSVAHILRVPLDQLSGRSLQEISTRHGHLQAFKKALTPHLDGSESDWQQQLELFGSGGHQVLMCRGTALTDSDKGETDHVIVFDDITALLRGQRDAAWSEVARRLAHEIKNPLTPIQLSAERLRHKYLHSMPPADAEVLDRLTHTIVQQVETMKVMVNSFSDYARSPHMQPEAVALNRLVNEVIDLFRNVDPKATIETDLVADLPALQGDPARLRQVLNNLIKNALEAGSEGTPWVRVSSRIVRVSTTTVIELRIEDRGPGIEEELLARIFEPYVTSKTKGTGLGLAIVKKIIEEHSGMVWLENIPGGGACAVIQLPVSREPEATVTTIKEETV